MGGIFGDVLETRAHFGGKRADIAKRTQIVVDSKQGQKLWLWKSGDVVIQRAQSNAHRLFFGALRRPQVLLITQDPPGTEKHLLNTLETNQFEVRRSTSVPPEDLSPFQLI